MNPIFDIILFAIIALFLYLRLRGRLGQFNEEDKQGPKISPKTNEESAKEGSFDPKAGASHPTSFNKVGRKRWPNIKPDFELVSSATVHERLVRVHNHQPDLKPYDFLTGAMRAYDMTVRAFHDGDLTLLKTLTRDDLYQSMSQTIKEREESGDQDEPNAIPLAHEMIITDASHDGDIVSIVVDIWAIDPAQSGNSKKKSTLYKKDMIHDRWRFDRDFKTDQENRWYLAEIIDTGDDEDAI